MSISPVDDIDRALFVIGIERHRRAGVEIDVGENRVPFRLDRRAQPEHRAGDDPHRFAFALRLRQFVRAVMRESRRHFLIVHRQRDPALQAVQAVALGAPLEPGAFGMRDAAAGRHPVDFARTDGGESAEAVAMLDFAVEQIGDGRKPDMRMRAHIDADAGLEFRRAHMIDKDERPDHAALRRGQRAADFEACRDRSCAARSRARSRRTGRCCRARDPGRGKSSCRILTERL